LAIDQDDGTELDLISREDSILPCDGSGITLLPAGPLNNPVGFSWTLDGIAQPQFDSEPVIVVFEPGLYEFFATVALGDCTLSDSLRVFSSGSTQVDLGPDLTINAGQPLPPDAQLDPPLTTQTLDWQPPEILSCTACLDPSLAPVNDTEIILTVTDSQGCTASDTLLITVLDTMPGPGTGPEPIIGDSLIYFPTIFQSGLPGNDQLIIGVDVTEVSQVEMSVYDRWGNLMAEVSEPVTANQLLIWDGRRDSQPAEPGVYVYMAKYLQLNGLEKVSVGTFTLIR